MIPAVVVFLISFVVVSALRRLIKNKQTKPSLPPGPVPIPLLGNILSINTKEPWLTYTQWHAVYGDLIFVRVLNQNALVINSQQTTQALMDKRSSIYSDRPYLATAEPCGWSINFAFTGYNDEWRRCRRLFRQTFRADSAIKFRPLQMRRARELIVNLIDDPQHYHHHIATFTSSIGMSTIYDYQPSARDDPMVQIVENALIIGLEMMTPERAALLNVFPFLLKVPDWCWGSSIKLGARASANSMRELADVPFRYTQQHMADSSSSGQMSMVAENLRRMEKQDEASKLLFETDLKKTATYRHDRFDVQRRAQAEINSYVESVLRETLRWQPIAPIGIPHATSSDDIYDGYFIPKGLLGITRDEMRYPDASRFMPERFLDANGALTDDNPAEYVFGAGLRICPGRHTVDATLWSAIATMLAAVEFSFARDDQGKVIDFTPQFTGGLTHSVLVFPCNISPRSHICSELVDCL
ncbi:cytochrome P450 [Suillus occidentalis]|nr:cytochrome P450 [Suillus occidentalis]